MQPGVLLSYSAWGISLEWTEEEQRTLETFLIRFPAERFDPIQRYIRIAAALPRKNVRDVALRARWTVQQQLRKRTALDPRKPGMPPIAPKPLISMVPSLPGSIPPPFIAPPTATVPSEGSLTIDGPIPHLLEANIAILSHFRSNMAAFKVHENTQLLVQFRDNILQILHAMEAMGGVMAEMPQLPVRLNVDLANNFLPSRPAGVLTYDGMVMPPPPQPALNAPGMVPLNGFAPGGGTTVQVHTVVAKPMNMIGNGAAIEGTAAGGQTTAAAPNVINTTITTAAEAAPGTTVSTSNATTNGTTAILHTNAAGAANGLSTEPLPAASDNLLGGISAVQAVVS